jgi:hypothetical protein
MHEPVLVAVVVSVFVFLSIATLAGIVGEYKKRQLALGHRLSGARAAGDEVPESCDESCARCVRPCL